MAVTRVGVAGGGTENYSGGTWLPPYGQSPTAGNILTMGIIQYSLSALPTCATPTGWTAGPTTTDSVSAYIRYLTFWKVASGGDAAPSMAVVNTASSKAVIEEWASSDGWVASPYDAASSVTKNTQNNTSSGTCNSGSVTTTAANDFVWSFVGAYTDALKTLTWAGGSTVSAGSTWTSGYYLDTSTAAQSPTTAGTYTPTLAFAATGTWVAGATASMAFKTGTAPPPGASIAIDASSPALAANTATTVTTASFTPPAGALLVALAGGFTTATTVTGSNGNTWRQLTATPSGSYRSAVWVCDVGAPVAQTVTVSNANAYQAVKVLVVTGAAVAASQGGVTATAATATVTLTPTMIGSLLVVADTDGTGTATAIAGTTLDASDTTKLGAVFGHQTALVSALTSATFGFTTAGSPATVGAEIQAAAAAPASSAAFLAFF